MDWQARFGDADKNVKLFEEGEEDEEDEEEESDGEENNDYESDLLELS